MWEAKKDWTTNTLVARGPFGELSTSKATPAPTFMSSGVTTLETWKKTSDPLRATEICFSRKLDPASPALKDLGHGLHLPLDLGIVIRQDDQDVSAGSPQEIACHS